MNPIEKAQNELSCLYATFIKLSNAAQSAKCEYDLANEKFEHLLKSTTMKYKLISDKNLEVVDYNDDVAPLLTKALSIVKEGKLWASVVYNTENASFLYTYQRVIIQVDGYLESRICYFFGNHFVSEVLI
jgi:hypothetical protein